MKFQYLPYMIYSKGSLMWTPEGRAKSVHISEPSTVVHTWCCGHSDYGQVYCYIGLYRKNKRAGEKVST